MLIAGEDFAAAPTFIVRRFVFQFQRITTGERAVPCVRLAQTSAPRVSSTRPHQLNPGSGEIKAL